ISYGLFTTIGMDPIVSVLISMPAMFLLGIVLYRLLFSQIAESPRQRELSVLLTFALALIVEGTLAWRFTGTYRTTNPPYTTAALIFEPFYLPQGQFYATIMSVVLILLLLLFLQFSRVGYAIRATMQNRTAAQVVGVNVGRISLLAFGIGMALSGASGSLMSFLFTFYPGKHWEWIAILLSLIVLGGMGSLMGALIGAFVLAIAASFVSFHLGPTWSPITFFLAL
ncbi:MAG: branched-chain amino acid ABC transporter permease, partial [Anaerolineae bacterium]|nr:branched-chain amino acid ABC transporter permease [Anaerolineae bacterium]